MSPLYLWSDVYTGKEYDALITSLQLGNNNLCISYRISMQLFEEGS